MPITYVLKVNVPSDQSIQQHKELLEKRLVALRPRRLNKFEVQTVVYQTPNQNQIHQFLHSDYSATCFSLIEPSASSAGGSGGGATNAADLKILTGDIGLASIQRSICQLGILNERKPLQIECTGSAFKIGDFQIKIGAVTHNSSNRGLLAEISYSSACNNQDAFGVISEFITNYFGWNIGQEMLTNLVRRKTSQAIYTPEDTIVQYYEHFNNFRNFSSANQPQRLL
jgi:hypothetical protein